jgi:hypothetical protein
MVHFILFVYEQIVTLICYEETIELFVKANKEKEWDTILE